MAESIRDSRVFLVVLLVWLVGTPLLIALAATHSFGAPLLLWLGFSLLAALPVALLGYTLRSRAAELADEVDRLREVISQAPFPMIVVDSDRRVHQVNAAWVGLSGYARSELSTLDRWSAKALGDRTAAFDAALGDVLRVGERRDVGTFQVHTPSGRERVWELSAMPFGRRSDHQRRLLVMGVDVTDLFEARDAAAELSDRLGEVLDEIETVVFSHRVDADRACEFVGAAIGRLLGLEAEEFERRGARLLDWTHLEDRRRVSEMVAEASRTGRPFRAEYRMVDADGHIRWVEERSRITRDARGPVCRGVIWEVSRERGDRAVLRALAGLSASEGAGTAPPSLLERGLELLLELLGADYARLDTRDSQGVWGAQVAVGETTLDPALPRLAPDLPPAPIRDRVPAPGRPEDRLDRLGIAVRREGRIEGWFSILRHGAPFAEWEVAPARAIAEAICTSFHTQTERVRARLLERAVENSPLAVVITNPEGRIQYVNPHAARSSGYDLHELIGENPKILKSGHTDDEEYAELWRDLSRGASWHGLFHNRRKDGTLYWEEAWISPFVDASGATLGFIAIKEDVTEKRRLEEQLVQKLKLESVGQLAAGIAHDFNNVLLAVIGECDLIAASEDPKEVEQGIASIRNAAERGASLTSQFLAFGRTQMLRPSAFDVAGAVEGMTSMLARLLPAPITLTFTRSQAEVPVLADRGQIEQVIMNLVLNARDSIEANGRIDVRVATTSAEENGARPVALIEVADTGQGIPEQIIENIFDPFFTTKPVGEGTGLGLSTVHGIVHQSGGTIEVESEVGRGSTFRVRLPLTEVPISREAEAAPTRRGRIDRKKREPRALLVDDEDQVRHICRRVLERLSFKVIDTGDPREAARLGQELEDLDLVLSDIVMPGMDGIELVARIRETNPNIAAVFMSGYSKDRMKHPGSEGDAIFLQKPFGVAELEAALAAAIDLDR